MSLYRLAIILCSYNRCEKTRSFLSNLYRQQSLDFTFDIWLVDDASTDDTAKMVANEFPMVNLLKGTGGLYWTGAMSLAMECSSDKSYDLYIWANDDVLLFDSSIQKLIECYEEILSHAHTPSVIVGSMQSAASKEVTYGGVEQLTKLHPLKFKRLLPSDRVVRCDTFNANLVLIPSQIIAKVGKLDTRLRHKMGDYDYGLRVKQAGFPVYVAPGIFGICDRNSIKGTWEDFSLPLKDQLRLAFSVKGIPFKDRFYYVKKHAGIFWPFYYLSPYLMFFARRIFSEINKIIARN